MSGIFGVRYFDEREVKPKVLQQISDVLVHRGSDGADIWQQDGVGLGHRLLWTTPESLLEKQPLTDSDENLVIVADARIDNREELISLLDFKELPAEKITDIDLILKAYQKWGKDCPQKLLGDFAFAIWDKPKQQLFCARDHFGVKPFYYYCAGNTFAFASEIKGILCLPEVAIQINEVRIGDYLTSTLEDPTITSYQNVWRLPPAHTLTIDCQNNLKLNRYWSLEPGTEIKLGSDLEYAEKFREIFTEAVRCRLRSAFPVGSHLSGGLDSSSVTCVARDLLQQQDIQLHTFSNIFDSVPECNEREYIERIIEDGGLIPHFIDADLIGPLSEWSDFYKYFDESLIGNCYLLWGLNRVTSNEGVRVVLNGFDGDTTVSHGALRLVELARSGEWETFVSEGTTLAEKFGEKPHLVLRHYGLESLKHLAKKGRWLSFFRGVNTISQHLKLSPRKLILNYGLKAIVPDNIKQTWRKLRRGTSIAPNPFPLIDSEFAKRINLPQRIQQFDRSDDPPSTVKEHHWRELTSGLMSIPLEGMDTLSSAFGIESRHPFMDKRLIEYCLALPAEQKLSQGWSRIVLRRAMENILPPEIQWRGGKSDLTPSIIKSLLKFDREIIEDVMLHKSEMISDFVDREKLADIYYNSFSKNRCSEKTINTIWSSLCLCFWMEQHKN